MPSSKKLSERVSNSTLVAALSNSTSGWIDVGRHCAFFSVLRTVTNGTYGLEIDWSRDGGSTTLVTDTITTTDGVVLEIPAKARWFRSRVKNTHGTNAFTAHSTKVSVDAAGGAGG